MGTRSPAKRGRGIATPNFGPCLLWPNGRMDQDETWHGGRPRPMQHCVRWGDGDPAPPKCGIAPNFRPNVYCGQRAGCIRIPLGTEVGLGPGDILLDGDPAPAKRGTAPSFRPMSIVAKRSPLSATGELLL